MKVRFLATAFAGLLALCLSAVPVRSVKADDDKNGRKPLSKTEQSRLLVSAKAGGVNLVEGDVTVKHEIGDWQMVIAGDELGANDVVKTGDHSRAEILLYPGSYLRVSSNTAFSFADISLNNLKIKLDAGSAIIELSGVDQSATALALVQTPKGEISIFRSGVYHFDVDSSGKAVAEVFKGRATLGGAEIKDGHKAAFDGSTPAVASLAKSDSDEFDSWSRDRAKNLVEANSLLGSGALPDSPAYFGGFGGSGGFGGFGIFDASFANPCSGFWMFNPLLGSYLYLPNFGGGCYPSLYSPYGFEYLTSAYFPVGFGGFPGRTGPLPRGGGFVNHHPVVPPGGVQGARASSKPRVVIVNRSQPFVSRGSFGSGFSGAGARQIGTSSQTSAGSFSRGGSVSHGSAGVSSGGSSSAGVSSSSTSSGHSSSGGSSSGGKSGH